MKLPLIFVGLMLLGTLAACGSDKKDKSADADTTIEQEDKATPICPQVAIVSDLAEVHDYGTEKPSPSALVAASRMHTVSGDCGYRDDGIDIAFTLHFIGARGPHLDGKRMEFPFFIAIVDPDGNIVDKNMLTTAFKFSGDDKTADRDEDLHIFIPLQKKQQKTGPDYRVLMGFQLTEAQWEVARNKAPGKPEAP